jgi:hypothetical protein
VGGLAKGLTRHNGVSLRADGHPVKDQQSSRVVDSAIRWFSKGPVVVLRWSSMGPMEFLSGLGVVYRTLNGARGLLGGRQVVVKQWFHDGLTVARGWPYSGQAIV